MHGGPHITAVGLAMLNTPAACSRPARIGYGCFGVMMLLIAIVLVGGCIIGAAQLGVNDW